MEGLYPLKNLLMLVHLKTAYGHFCYFCLFSLFFILISFSFSEYFSDYFGYLEGCNRTPCGRPCFHTILSHFSRFCLLFLFPSSCFFSFHFLYFSLLYSPLSTLFSSFLSSSLFPFSFFAFLPVFMCAGDCLLASRPPLWLHHWIS